MEKINRTLLITTTKKEMKEDPDAWTDPPRSQILGFNALKIKIPGCSRHGAVGSVSMAPQLRLRFNPWPGNFHVPWVQPKRKKKKKFSTKYKFDVPSNGNPGRIVHRTQLSDRKVCRSGEGAQNNQDNFRNLKENEYVMPRLPKQFQESG